MEACKKIIYVFILGIVFSFSVSALNITIEPDEFQLRVEKCNGDLVGIYIKNTTLVVGKSDYILILQERETNLTYIEMVRYPVDMLNDYKKPLTVFIIIIMFLILIVLFYSVYKAIID